ncbi:MAG: helix-turn-helix transcriptional regulator, partial [Planctomycetes bacterium]|nr:helix-turn-helix transcriptional regulator [Planctomycetota bacterium]
QEMQGLSLYNVYYLAEAFVRDTRLLLEAPLLCQLFLGHHLFPERDQGMIVHQQLGSIAAAAIFHELDWLAGSVAMQTQASPLLMRASLLKCLALIEADFTHQGMSLHSPLEDPLVRFVMMKSDAAMNEGMPAQIDAWAEEYGWTPDHLSRSFKAITGESPSVYHQRRRLQRAADELIHGASSLTEIAMDLGFADSAHFTRGFRKQFAMTPSAYRRRFR